MKARTISQKAQTERINVKLNKKTIIFSSSQLLNADLPLTSCIES
jgi:hypothetical protein